MQLLEESPLTGESFADYLDVVRPDVSPVLIAPDAMAAIREVAGSLPGSLALRTYGFECSLTRPEPVADFLLIIGDGGRKVLADSITVQTARNPVWRSLRQFLTVWDDPRSALHRAVDNAWLEYDVSRTPGVCTVPSVFHGLRRTSLDDPETQLSTGEQWKVTSQAMGMLAGQIDPSVLRKVQSCFELLPAGGRVFQLGAMLGRTSDGFRVCASLPSPSQIVPYLNGLGWRGDEARLEALLTALDGRVDHLCVDFDVAESIRPQIGIECYLERDGRPQRERWAPFLDFLASNHLAFRPKCQGLLDYPGHVDVRRHGERWPPALREASALVAPAAGSVFVRAINHVKLTLRPEQVTEAKAYLSVRHLWLTWEHAG